MCLSCCCFLIRKQLGVYLNKTLFSNWTFGTIIPKPACLRRKRKIYIHLIGLWKRTILHLLMKSLREHYNCNSVSINDYLQSILLLYGKYVVWKTGIWKLTLRWI
jgi:hypothetical protein